MKAHSLTRGLMICGLAVLSTSADRASAEGLVGSTDHAARIAERWPGTRLAKVSEAEFEAFLQSAAAGERAALLDAFHTAQHRSHGLGRARQPGFLSRSAPFSRTEFPQGDRGVFEGPEPNGDPNGPGGGVPTRFDCGDHAEGVVDTFGDTDWWQFDLAAARDIVAITNQGRSAPRIDDTVLELRDALGTLITANDDAPGYGRFSRIDASLAAGTYYLVVRGFASVRVGSYALDLFCVEAGSGGGRVSEAPEPNNSPGTAARMNCGDTGFGTVGFVGDADWFGFVLHATTDVVGETAPGPTNAIRDTTLTLFDAVGRQLAFDDDGGNGLFSRISIRLNAGTYYWSVAGFGSNTGAYELLFRCVGVGGGSGGASFDARPGGCAGIAGVPTVSARPRELPQLGGTFAIDFVGLPAAGRGLAFLGTSTTVTSSGVALPFSLAALGAPGCQLEVDPLLVGTVVANPLGETIWFLPIPARSDLVGFRFHVQALVIDPAANQLGATTSNRGDGVIGSRP